MGAQSMFLLSLALQGKVPGAYSITADTGWETDCVWNCGKRTTAREFYDQVIVPLCKGSHITPIFARTKMLDGTDRMPLEDRVNFVIAGGNYRIHDIPLFGSRKGRLRQTCTDKWKIRAINQTLRSLGASTARTAQGIHIGEASRRVKGQYLGDEGGYAIYGTTIPEGGKEKRVKWLTHFYPLVDMKLNRAAIRGEMEKLGIPFLVSSECDGCPHKDLDRWERISPETLARVEKMEQAMHGEFFFTPERVPIRRALEIMRSRRDKGEMEPELDFGCGNSICGI